MGLCPTLTTNEHFILSFIHRPQKFTIFQQSDSDSFSFAVDQSFCTDKFDGFFEDPNNCTVFYQCLKGKATKRHCLKGMVFNPLLKTCDIPQDFPCRTAEGADTVQIETNTPEVKPSPRAEKNSNGSQILTNLATSGTEMSAWYK